MTSFKHLLVPNFIVLDPLFSLLPNLTFIVEEPYPSFFIKACRHRDSTDSICWDHWWKHIQSFHFVYASPQHTALYSRLDVPDCSQSATKMKAEIATFMIANPGLGCLPHYHLLDQNLITPFLLVFNNLLLPPAVGTIFQQINWKCITRTRPYSEEEMASKEGGSSAGKEHLFLPTLITPLG
jgi:hypothetical protein